MDTDTNMDTDYLKRHVGDALEKCLHEVSLKRPIDPIEFMGQYLYKHVQNVAREKQKIFEAKELIRQQKEWEAEQLRLQQLKEEKARLRREELERRLREEAERKQREEEERLLEEIARQEEEALAASLATVKEGAEPDGETAEQKQKGSQEKLEGEPQPATEEGAEKENEEEK